MTRSLLVVIAAALAVRPLAAQSPTASAASLVRAGDEAPEWPDRWSPLVPLAELSSAPLGAGWLLPDLLTMPAPRVGLLWTAGVPADLAREVRDGRTVYRLARGELEGEYRRPLDPAGALDNGVAAYGWGPLGERGAGIARVAVDRTTVGSPAFGDVLDPYATEPYSVADTLGEALRRTAVRLEGAGGWSVGSVGLGVAAGYVQQDTRTVESGAPVFNLTASPGLTGGAAVPVPGLPARLAVFGRWQQTVEVVTALSSATASRVYRFAGYDDPVAIDLTDLSFGRRFERRAWGVGLALAGTVAGGEWTIYAQRHDRATDTFNTSFGTGARDLWRADGWAAGAAVQRAIGDRVLVTVDGATHKVIGTATFHDLGVAFTANDKRWHVRGDLRFEHAGWLLAGRLAVIRESRHRADSLAFTYSDIHVWRPAGAIEIVRRLGAVNVALGGAVAEHNPAGGIPNPASLGPVYFNWIAPAVAFNVTEARARAALAALRWDLNTDVGIWLKGFYEHAAPPRVGARITGAPRGNRTRWDVAFGVVLTAPARSPATPSANRPEPPPSP